MTLAEKQEEIQLEVERTVSEMWAREIEKYSYFCGPAVVAAVLSISRGEAADKLLEIGTGYNGGGWTAMSSVAKVLGKKLESANLGTKHARTGVASRVKFTDTFPTVNQWLQANPTRIAIIRASNHVMYVGFGHIFEANGVMIRKGRVTHVIFVD
jgi:ABC-type sugar transport system substrate-binding protein